MPLAEKDATLSNFDNKNAISQTPLYIELEKHIADILPKVVVIDTRADVFGGDEIKRHQVRTFVALLRRLAMKYDTAIVMLSHPSLTGMGTGTGQSGSTSWGNTVRSRMYLERVFVEKVETDKNLRTLSTKKINYGPDDTNLRIRWSQGIFVREKVADVSATDAAAQADAKFVELLTLHSAQNLTVTAKPGVSNYAPKTFAKHSESGNISERAFKVAMERLLGKNAIKNVQHGPPSKCQWKLVPADYVEPSATAKPTAATIALDALKDLLEAAGTGSVTVEAWREAAYDAGISKGGPAACKMAFNRARDALVEAGTVVINGDQVSLGATELQP